MMSETTVSLVGSTGSIGTQAVEVVEANPGRFRIVALAAQQSWQRLAEQARRLRPDLVAIGDPAAAPALRSALPRSVELLAGPEGLAAAATAADVVVNGVVGFAGLPVTLAALGAGARLALANKESLIAGAPVVQQVRSTPGALIVPVDSEHCAIHQCLSAVPASPGESGSASPGTTPSPATTSSSVRGLVITASGGPFRGRGRDELAGVTVGDALAHPTWSMGPKITVDSSTLMNKGLEVIEAHELFGIPYDRISVTVHPQSIVHSMVQLADGSTLAQLSRPDMRMAIGYAMGWPERLSTPFGALDWSESFELTFEPPDRTVFSCLDLAYRAGEAGGSAPAWLNAANEVAVAAFLAGDLAWLGIAEVVEATLDQWPGGRLDRVDDVLQADAEARRRAGEVLGHLEVAV